MQSRPLFTGFMVWALGLWVAFSLGVNLEKTTSLDLALGSGTAGTITEGTITNTAESEYGGILTLGSCTVFLDGYEEALKTHSLLVYCENTDYKTGDRIKVSGTIKGFDEPDNPGEFNKRLYYRVSGIDYRITAESVEIIEEGSGVDLLSEIKNRLSRSIDSVAETSSEAGLFKSVLLGDRSGLEEETYELFKISGIAHILAISGLHLSIVASAIMNILKKLKVPHVVSAIIAEGILLAYVIMIDGSSSAWRALIMFSLSALAPLIGRTYDMLSALGFAGILMLFYEPLYVADGAFQLSFGAIASIGIIYPALVDSFKFPVFKKISKEKGVPLFKQVRFRSFLVNSLAKPLLLSFSIQIGTLPIVAHNYYTITPYGILLNLIALPLVSTAMLSVFLAAIFGLASASLGAFMAGAAHLIFTGLIKICEVVSRLPGASLVVGDPQLWMIVVYYLLLAAILLGLHFLKKDMKQKKITRIAASARPGPVAAVMLLLTTLLLFFTPCESSITALYVGQGDCTVICGENGECVLVDCGSSSKNDVSGSVILPFLKSRGISHIDMVLLSHGDGDHVNGLEGLLKDPAIETGCVALSKATSDEEAWEEVLDVAAEAGAEVCYLDAEDEILIGDYQFRIISPSIEKSLYFDDENDNSMVIYLKYGDFTALFPGDISSEAEAVLAGNELLEHVDFLKCPHHGSKYSSSSVFLQALSPSVVTVSAGRNNLYGHPSEVALQRISEAGATYFRTDTLGAVTTTIQPGDTTTGAVTLKVRWFKDD